VLRIENRSNQTIRVPYVRLQGSVMGLTLYAYTTEVDMVVPPGGTDERSFPVDLLDIGAQATGLIPSQVVLLSGDATPIDSKAFRADVRGKVSSVYGLFGMAIGALALLLLAGILWRLARGKLSPNRWRRGVSLAAVGLGLGFLVTFSLSALRIAVPEAGLWSSLVGGGAALGFIAGYASPTPEAAGGSDVAEPRDAGADGAPGGPPVPRSPADEETDVLEQAPDPDEEAAAAPRGRRLWRV
jgi:hypothetical protein